MLGVAATLLACSVVGCVPAPKPPTRLIPPAPVFPPAPAASLPAESAASPVVLVQASSSAPNAQERTYSSRLTTRIADWLRNAGIPVRVVDDDALTRGAWTDAHIVMLCYNPNPGLLERLALGRFIRRGGKVMVFYSAEPQLAALLGMKLGAYLAASTPDQWSGFAFTQAAPDGIPARIEQNSLNIRPAFPDGPRSQVIAWWEDASGKRRTEPAWTVSAHGGWMSHVLLEGDREDKTRMLVALLGAWDPALWRLAAAHALKTSGTLGRYTDTAQTISALRRQAGSTPDSTLDALLAQADQLQDALARDYHAERYNQVLAGARRLTATLNEAYARTQTPRAGEFRGIWNHSGTGLYPGDWNQTCRILAQNGLTAVFPHVSRPWAAHYKGGPIPVSDTVRRYGDQLRQCTDAARRYGLEVHAWVICWNLEGAPEGVLAGYRKQGRLQVSATGASLPWLCPSNPANLEFELATVRDLVERYPVAGVHLDYIRYKSQDYCYCSGCRTRFSRETGKTIRHWPGDVRGGPLTTAWREWRRDQITRLVSQTRRLLRTQAPDVKLSAAVYTGYPGCRDSIGQDWGEWVRLGYVDFACPMNYTEDNRQFAAWYQKQSALPGMKGRLYAGIGVTATESRLDAAAAIDQILTLRREGANGFMLFDANRTLEREVLPYLAMGITADRAR